MTIANNGENKCMYEYLFIDKTDILMLLNHMTNSCTRYSCLQISMNEKYDKCENISFMYIFSIEAVCRTKILLFHFIYCQWQCSFLSHYDMSFSYWSFHWTEDILRFFVNVGKVINGAFYFTLRGHMFYNVLATTIITRDVKN